MLDPSASGSRPSIARVALTASVLLAGLLPMPAGWVRNLRDVARSQDLNRADREATAGGYYEGLIGGAGKNSRGVPSALEIALVGKPIDRNRDLVRRITRDLKDDFLQFELRPNYDEVLFGERFTTNAEGMRDRDYSVLKPDGVFRIVLLGSSIDMGWGVATPDTYENRLEAWLNDQAERRGLIRRFEVLNFSVAAYGPAQRYDVFHRRALPYQPDLVLFSSTMLDPRLTEIHLGGLIKNNVDLKYDFFRETVAGAGIDPERERRSTWEQLDRRGGFKARVKDHYWNFADATIATLAADCRSLDIPLATMLVPRACRDDDVDARSLAVARQTAISARHAVPLLDLSETFDAVTPRDVEVAPGDDHPNPLGHHLLFDHLAQLLSDHPTLTRTLFGSTDRPADPTPACRCVHCVQTRLERASRTIIERKVWRSPQPSRASHPSSRVDHDHDHFEASLCEPVR